MKNIKRKIIGLSFLFVLALSLCLGVNAAVTPRYKSDYRGTVNHNWGYCTTGNNFKNTTGGTVINWQYSSQSGAHNMWYRAVNSNGADRGSVLMSYLSSVEFSSSTQWNYYYYLQARRENSVDPTTTVSGYWIPW